MTIGRRKSDIIDRMFGSYILSSILVMLSVPVHEIIDGILLSRSVSPDALSMVALLAPVNIFFFAIKTFLVAGLSIMSAKALGACEYEKGSKMFTVALTSNTAVILLLTSGAYLFFPQFVGLFCDESSLLYPLLYEYAQIILLQFPLLAIMSSLDTYMRLVGKARLASISIIVSCLLNILLTWVFLYVFHLGIKGAACATILCSVLTKLSYLPYLFSGKFPFRFVRIRVSEYFHLLFEGVKVGSPCAVNDIFMSLIFFTTNGIVFRTQGAQGMFVWSVTLQLLSLSEMISNGFIGVNQHIGSLLYGENDNEGFHILVRKSFLFQVFSIAAVILLCILIPHPIFDLFSGGSQVVTNQYVMYFLLGVSMILPMRVCIFMTESLIITEHTAMALLFNLLYLGAIFLAAFFSVFLGTAYFWWLLPILQWVVVLSLLATTTIKHFQNRYYSWFAMLPVASNEVSMLMKAKYDPAEIKPMLEKIAPFLDISELQEKTEFNSSLICEELLYHVIAEKKTSRADTFEIRLVDKPQQLLIILKEVGAPRDLSSFLKRESLSTQIISNLAPQAKYDYYNGVCVVAITIPKTLAPSKV